jgi:hypothetical protein
MSEHDIQQFIDGQQSKNTIKKTLRDVDFVEKSFPFEKGREGHAFKASRVKLNDTFFIPVPNGAMIECPYCVRRSFLSPLLMLQRKVHGSKSPPSFFLTIERLKAK